MLDFPTTIRLGPDEKAAVDDLIRREPLVTRSRVMFGLVIIGLNHVRTAPNGFKELLDLLRVRRSESFA